jgi:hypothetical protein
MLAVMLDDVYGVQLAPEKLVLSSSTAQLYGTPPRIPSDSGKVTVPFGWNKHIIYFGF